ncbi:YgaP family membrane protein [Haloarchaeobius sp. TZWSO28]|uniref:YgaP family membrane protein n=1 Tax=unclassified Haloarchaeobius TaxID=2614452 RepID=UPI003EBE3C5F
MERNVDDTGQMLRVGLGSVAVFAGMVAGAGFQRTSLGVLLGVLGATLLLTGALRVCPLGAVLD